MADRHGADLACGLDRPTQSRVLDLVGNQRLPSPPCQQIPTSLTGIVMIDKRDMQVYNLWKALEGPLRLSLMIPSLPGANPLTWLRGALKAISK